MPVTSSSMLLYQIALTMLPGVGAINARKLIAHVGSADALFTEKKSSLLKIHGIGEYVAHSLSDSAPFLNKAEKEIAFIEKHKVKTYFITDENYPYRLTECADSPILLYALGNMDLDAKYMVSIVGTRKASDYGIQVCHQLIEGLKELGVVITSGLAYGIDTAAHKDAMGAGLSTIGVLAHGLDRIYPPENTKMAKGMLENGGLLTEFMSHTKPERENFPMRNRIIAGLSDATIVIEAGAKGGALITANIANSYSRDVFAVPGRLTDSYSEGCNNLIKTNQAALVQKAEDVMYIMGWDKLLKTKKPLQRKLFITLAPDQETIVNILQKQGECSIDKICMASELSISKVSMGLLNLEFEGIVKSLPGKMYKLA